MTDQRAITHAYVAVGEPPGLGVLVQGVRGSGTDSIINSTVLGGLNQTASSVETF